ncbi:MAG: hypothetical protein ACPF9D_08030 [Owenweeksia sp.]
MIIKPFLLFFPILFNMLTPDTGWQSDKIQVLSKSIVKIMEMNPDILEPEGLKISQCQIFVEENSFVKGLNTLEANNKKVCIRDKGILFQLSVGPYLTITDLQIGNSSASIAIELGSFNMYDPSLSEGSFVFKLSKTDGEWNVIN